MRQQEGFSLVEVMVGLVIGLVAMLVMTQVFQTAEGLKRTSTSGANAQTSGAVAAYLIERDIRMAGWGLNPALYFGQQTPLSAVQAGCTTMNTYCNGSAACGGSNGPIAGFTFANVIITDGGNAGPDTVTAQFFGDPAISSFVPPAVGTLVSDTGGPPTNSMGVSNIPLSATFGCQAGWVMLLSDPIDQTHGNCLLEGATTVTAPSTIAHATGACSTTSAACYNKTTPWPTTPTPGKAQIACFQPASDGPIFHRIYSVDVPTGRLMRKDNSVTPTVTEAITEDIMDLQAQYGIANVAGSQTVNQWVDATGVWVNPTLAQLKQIKAVRVAVLARSAQYEKPKPTDPNCTAAADMVTTDAMVAGWSAWATFNTATFPVNWRCYRYKVFQTIVPLRNVIWANV